MSLYRRENSDSYWGYLRIGGKTFRKCLHSSNKSESEKLLYEWKNELLTDPTSPVSEYENTFRSFSQKLIDKQKSYPLPPSEIPQWIDTKRLLNRENGLHEFFGDTDIRSIKRSDVEEFIQQLPINKRRLSTSTIKKHLNILKQVLQMSDIHIDLPRVIRGKKSERRGYFNLDEYKTIRDKSRELVGFEYTERNGTVYKIDEDLHDFIIFMVGSMLRPTVSEVYSLQHKHIQEKVIERNGNSTIYLEFPLTRKTKKMLVQTLETSYFSYKNLCERREKINPEDYVFLPQYKNRRYCMTQMSRMFDVLITHLDMKYGKLGEKRTTYSLRHTSLIFNLSQPNVDHFDICKRSDTSMKMIEDWYYPESQTDETLHNYLRV